MRKLYFVFILLIFNSCCTDCTDDLQETELLSEEVFKQNNASFGKVLQGNDGIYNYKAFGNFKSSGTSGLYIPQDISFIEQTLIGTSDERTIIKVDRNFLPTTIYNIKAGVKDTMEYHVYYLEEEILIHFDEENEDGTFTTLSKIGIPRSIQSRNQEITRDKRDSDCDFFNEESDINPCSNNNIYEDVAQDWEDYTDGTPIKKVGKAVSWIIKISLAKICSNSNRGMEKNKLSCEDLKEDKNREDLCGILISCEPDCNGEAYGAAYKTPCQSCVGGKTQEMPLAVSWTYTNHSEGCWTMYAHISGGQAPFNISWGDSSMLFCGAVGATGGVTVTDRSGCTATSTWVVVAGETEQATGKKSSSAPILLK